MKQYIIPLLFFWLITVTCDKPVGTDFTDPSAQHVAVSITASAQPSSIYKITISGPAMKTIGPQEYAGGQTIQLYVPAGSSRKFYFERYNSSQKLTDTGTTVSDIGAGMNTVLVTLSKATQPDSCTVNYIGNGNTGGKVPDSQRQIKGGSVKLDTNSGVLVKAEYAFRGWNTEPNGNGKDYQPGSNYTIDTNLTLYAKWIKLLTYTITYSGNGNTSGKAPVVQLKTEGVAITLAFNSDSLAKYGCNFVGWNTQENGNGKDYSEGANFTYDSSVTLYARWTRLPTYKITYRGNDSTGGTVPAVQTKVKGDDLTLAANTGNLVKTGFSFKGWNTQADGKGVDYTEGAKYTADTSVTLFASWVALQKFTVSYNGNENSKGTVPVSQSKYSGERIIIAGNSGNLEKTGYTFDGWCTSKDSTGKVYAKGDSYSDNADLLLYAKWMVQTFTITYDGNKNTKGVVPVSQIKIYGQARIISDNIGNLEKTDYIFVGWSTSADGTGTDYLKGANYTDNADILLYAKWKHKPYTITFDGNKSTKGEVPGPQIKDYDEALVLPDNTGNLEKTGFVFDGWSTSADGVGKDYPKGASYTDNADAVLYAKWKTLTFTVTYDGNGNEKGSAPGSQVKVYGEPLTLAYNSGNLSKTGYSFSGWSTSANGSGTDYNLGANYETEANLILYAKWVLLGTYTVDYSPNGSITSGTVPNTQTRTTDVPITIEGNTGNLVMTGYTFEGWNSKANGTGKDYVQGERYTDGISITLFAKWNALPFVYIMYQGNGNTGGEVPAVQTKREGIDLTLATKGSLVKTGFVFTGWNTSANGSGTSFDEGAVFKENYAMALYAQWKALEMYSVQYDGNGNESGTIPGIQTTTMDVPVIIDSNSGNLAKAGYTFGGWTTKSDGTGTEYIGGQSYSVTASIVLYVKWIPL
jgi:uncharacterized repeat protein (TIGR02543 family)